MTTPTAPRPDASTRAIAATDPAKPGSGTQPTPRTDAWDDEDEDRPYGDPKKLKDQGVLDSFGKAVSSPVVEAAEGDGRGKTPDRN